MRVIGTDRVRGRIHLLDPRRTRHRASLPIVLHLAALLASGPAAAQELPQLSDSPTEPAAADPVTPESIDARRRALAAELVASESAIREAQNDSLRNHLQQVREALGNIEGVLRQQGLLAAPGTAAGEAVPNLPDAVSPSFFALDALYEAQLENEHERSRRADALASAREALATSKAKLSDAETNRREARADLEEAQTAASKSSGERTLRIRQLASRAAQERVHLRTLEARVARAAQDRAEEIDFTELIEKMRDELARGESEPGSGLAALARREGDLQRSREEFERKLATAELRLDAAQRRFSRETNPPDEMLVEIEALTASRDAIREEIALTDAQLERLSTQRSVSQRFEMVLKGEATREELETWKTAAAARIETLDAAELLHKGRGEALERRLDAIQSRLRAVPENAGVRASLEEQRATLARRVEAERTEAAELAHDRRLSERLLAEVRDRLGEIDPLETMLSGVDEARELWSYEITAVDDSAITVGSLVLALLLASVGLWASRRGSGLIGRIAMSRLKLDTGAAHALETLSFYVLLVSFTLLALRAVHFPLTAFTVLGGALAIGIGFGSQNVMNNFISGLILMLERPVRVRDIIEVDGNFGSVEKIGARSTQIRSNDGRHIIVPNSFFLESNVVNWTLSDDLIRTSVIVGVIYGSPTRLVEQLIQRVVTEEERVIQQPPPLIIFDEFGDNSLNFEVHFWVRARSPMEKRVVQSRVRFRIDDLFREHDLVIAFPQRDVHLDSVKPIEVRVLNGPDQQDRQ